MKCNPVLSFSILMLFSFSALAAEQGYSESNTRASLEKKDQYGVTAEERSIASQFKLTSKDWAKYKQIMDGPWKYWNPDLDPLTALGVNEKNPAERKRYAEIWMQVETEKAGLMLDFERDRMQAARDLFGDQKMIETSELVREWKRRQSITTTTIDYFVDVSCKQECQSKTDKVLSSVSDTTRLNIYFTSGATQQDINVWATNRKIDPKVVAKGQITLNYDTGVSLRKNIPIDKFPMVVVTDNKTGKEVSRW